MADSIFRKESLKKVSSPESLNEYIKVSTPGVWMIITAAAALLIGALVWAAFGSVNSTVGVVGVAKDGVVRCYVADTAQIVPGCEVAIGDAQGTVRQVGDTALTKDAAAKDCGADDYTAYRLDLAEWSFAVVIDAPGVPDGVTEAKITVEKIRPIRFIFS